MPFHVSTEEFERIVGVALDSIPAHLRTRMNDDNLMVIVQPEATDADRSGDIDERVLGFYEGRSEATFSAFEYPKRIVLLQRHIEHWSSNHAQLVEQVTDTVLHEAAHYFGMNHDDIRQTRLRH
jgi:predicted Zn-dependent protease with MMP-like domain